MFILDASLLDKIRSAIQPREPAYAGLAFVKPAHCGDCTRTCSGSCQGTCTRSCKFSTR